MKLFSQHGFNDGQKTFRGIELGVIQGVIYSPKDISLERLNEQLQNLSINFSQAERLFDPQYYATLVANDPNARCGLLLRDYAAYFSARRRSQLEVDQKVLEDSKSVIEFQGHLNVTSVIAPNILIPRSFNSIEAAISKSFIRNAKIAAITVGEEKPIMATLAIGCEALRKHDELIEFLTDLTLNEQNPDGFYLLVGTSTGDTRYDICHPETLAGWMFLNHVLTLNGFRVINGYSDLATPLLGICGASAGATGWWSNLRFFNLSRFSPESGGGRLPVPRYLSCALLNRITFFELETLRNQIPTILNGLPTDQLYNAPGSASEPERNVEVLQSWDAINSLNESALGNPDIRENILQALTAIDAAESTYDDVEANILALDPKSDRSHLRLIRESLELFAELAEIDLT